MDAKIARLLVSVSDDLRIYEGYSGRGMFGNETTAVSGNGYEEAISCVDDETLADHGLTRHEFHKEIKKVRKDSLGLDYIWY